MNNITTRIPKRGDIVARKKNSTSGYVYSDKDNVFFVMENFVESEVSSTHEILGVVAQRFHDEVLVVFKKNYGSLKWCSRAWNTLYGFTLDGAEHTGQLKIRTSANWNTAVTKTITYTASDIDGMVTALNTAFAADSDFTAQDWYAVKNPDNTTIMLHYNHTDYRQYNNAAGTGFTLSSFMPGIPSLANMKRKNGGMGSSGASASFARYVAYYGRQAAATLRAEAPIKTAGVPMTKATYIADGNQQYLTNCIAKYGSGEAGWLKYMKSCKPIRETDYGNHGIHDGKARGAAYGTKRYTSSKITDSTPMMPASEKCYSLYLENDPATNQPYKTFYAGDFWLPTTQEMDYVMQDVLYGTAGTTGTEDDINSGLNKITGHVHISNGTAYWCGVRYDANYAWCTIGGDGCFGGHSFDVTASALPVSLFKIV